MILSTRFASLSGLVTKTQSGKVVIFIVLLAVISCEIKYVSSGPSDNDSGNNLLKISGSPTSVINPAASWSRRSSERKNNTSVFHIPPEEFQGESKSNSSSSGQTNNISDYIKNGELSAIFCERCTELQKKKVEQILYLLYNFNGNAGVDSSTWNPNPIANIKLNSEFLDKNYILKKKKRKFKTTSSPAPSYRKNLPEMIPTPETFASTYDRHQLSKIIQLPSTLSTTTPATSSPGYSSMAMPIVPYFYSPSSTSPLPSSSATVSSALEPLQSVEMPTPPMPPTTTGPIYLYYLGRATSSLSSSGSLEPPTTPVVESSVAYASKPTTIDPML